MQWDESEKFKRKRPKDVPEIGQSVDVMPADSKPCDYRTSWVKPSKGKRGKFSYTRIK